MERSGETEETGKGGSVIVTMVAIVKRQQHEIMLDELHRNKGNV
jgi:hypothetical protein